MPTSSVPRRAGPTLLAAERAESVGAPEAAEAAYLKAAELSSDEAEQAELTERAGRMAGFAGWDERARRPFRGRDCRLHQGRPGGRRRPGYRLARPVPAGPRRGEQAIARIREALASLEGIVAPPEVVADLQARLGGALILSGHGDEAAEPIEEALTLAQHYELAEPLASSLNSKAMLLGNAGRAAEARMLFEGEVSVARLHGLTRAELVAELNLADLCMTRDLPGAEEHARAALALARRWGLRGHEAVVASNLMYILTMAGRFDEVDRLGAEVLQAGGNERPGADEINYPLACLEALRGKVDIAARAPVGLRQLGGQRRLAGQDLVLDCRGGGLAR